MRAKVLLEWITKQDLVFTPLPSSSLPLSREPRQHPHPYPGPLLHLSGSASPFRFLSLSLFVLTLFVCPAGCPTKPPAQTPNEPCSLRCFVLPFFPLPGERESHYQHGQQEGIRKMTERRTGRNRKETKISQVSLQSAITEQYISKLLICFVMPFLSHLQQLCHILYTDGSELPYFYCLYFI